MLVVGGVVSRVFFLACFFFSFLLSLGFGLVWFVEDGDGDENGNGNEGGDEDGDWSGDNDSMGMVMMAG